MKTTHFSIAPQRFKDLWEWIIAIDSWKHGDEELLAELIKKEELPDEFRDFVSKIIAGEQKQKRKGKIPARERMKLARELDFVLNMIEKYHNGKVHDSIANEASQTICAYVAERKGVETKEMVEYLYSAHQRLINNTAKQLGVSEGTIKNLLRDMRSYINNWPLVQ